MADSLLDIKEILEDYTKDIKEGVIKCAEEVANEGKERLQATNGTYQIKTGKYNRGWKIKKQQKNNYISYTIHNKEYQLTHLLEYGHATRNGGRTKSFPHIKPVEEYCNEEFERKIEEVIKNA